MRTIEEKFDRVKASRNELEAFLRINGISKARFSRILDICEITSDRYIAEPVKLRYSHIKKIADYAKLNTKEVIDLIEYDLEGKQ
mgnify:FL=1|tara:strand:- start:1229 stop:1483 length:255 start_codon:yes stop_codon:yes gene_type:complete